MDSENEYGHSSPPVGTKIALTAGISSALMIRADLT